MSKIMTDFEGRRQLGNTLASTARTYVAFTIEMEATPNRATLLADYSSLLAALSDAKLTKVRDALPPARDLFGDEGAAAFLQTEQSYNVQLPSSASSMGSSPCESPRLELRTAAQASHTAPPAHRPCIGTEYTRTPDLDIMHRFSAGTHVRCAGTCGSNSR